MKEPFFSLSSKRCCLFDHRSAYTGENPSAFSLLSPESQPQLCSCRQLTSCLPPAPQPPHFSSSCCPAPVTVVLLFSSPSTLPVLFLFLSSSSPAPPTPAPPTSSTSATPPVHLQFSSNHTGGFPPPISDCGVNEHWVQYKAPKKWCGGHVLFCCSCPRDSV